MRLFRRLRQAKEASDAEKDNLTCKKPQNERF